MYPTLVLSLCFATVVLAAPAAERQLDVDENKFVRRGSVLELNAQNKRKESVPDINQDMFVLRGGGDILEVNPKYARKRNLVVGEEKLWENGVVPFYIHPEIEHNRGKIYNAMNHISNRTCIRFREKTDDDEEYIHIYNGGACFAYVGRFPEARNVPVSLGPGCEELIPGSHEIMHSLGVHHTQCRSDRDNHITIHFENMFEGANRSVNWLKIKEEDNQLLVPFDFDSIMLYGPYMGSANGGPAITANDPNQVYVDTYDKTHMSESDIKALNVLYKCERYGTQFAYDD